MSRRPVHKQGSRIHSKPTREDDSSISKTVKALAAEVRMRLVEVGKLREEHRNIQHELGYLMMMMMKAKYGPRGWKLPMPGPVGSDPLPPPEVPPPSPEPPCPVWRTLRNTLLWTERKCLHSIHKWAVLGGLDTTECRQNGG